MEYSPYPTVKVYFLPVSQPVQKLVFRKPSQLCSIKPLRMLRRVTVAAIYKQNSDMHIGCTWASGKPLITLPIPLNLEGIALKT